MFRRLNLKFLTALGLTLLLAGCPHVQLGGGVVNATVSVAPLREPSHTIQQLQTPGFDALRAAVGEPRWSGFTAAGKLLFLGNVAVDKALYDPESLYLVTAAGGEDYNADNNQQVDTPPTAVGGQWHAIMTGAQLSRGIVSTLTEAVYRSLELELDKLSDAEILTALHDSANGLVVDIDRSGSVDYDDVLLWMRQVNAGNYLGSLAQIDELAAAIRGAAAASTLRALSQKVLGTAPVEGTLFSVRGTISVTGSTRVDSDVNDTLADLVDNSSIANAQEVINPMVLGGYANLAGTGAEGSSFFQGDADDYFRADLLAGQRITLVMADDPIFNDLDLYLYDVNGELLDASLGLAEFEQLIVPADGTYNIGVSAFSGASNYRLTLGIAETSATAEQLRLSDDFVPGEIIANFRADNRNVDSMPKRRHFTGMRVRGGLGRDNLLSLPLQAQQAETRNKLKLRTLLALKRLRRAQEVSSADLNYYVQSAALPNDVYYTQQSWHYEMINLSSAWEHSLGDGVVVAVIDTGVLLNHPDLQGQLVPGYDFISSLSFAADGDGLDNNPDDPGDSTGSTRSSFHGTHVAGTIAAASNNTRGVSGIAWNARIMPLRVLGEGGGTTYDVIQAVRYAAGLDNDSNTLPSRPADIINLSLSGGGYSSSTQSLYAAIAERGIIVVAAAGNDNSDEFSYPASYQNVISVSAVNINRQRASYSNFGSRIDVAAPGGDSSTRDVNGDGIADMILSTSGDDRATPIRATYELLQGTSMAAPHVAGVAALMKSVYPQLNAAKFSSLLAQGLLTDELGSPGRDNSYGYGLINANRAVITAMGLATGGSIDNLPSISSSALALNFGNFTSSLNLSISNGGTGELFVNSIVPADNWLTITPNSVDADGLGSYVVTVDRSQLNIGSYNSAIAINSNAGAASVQVILQQPDPEVLLTGNAGLHYVLLFNVQSQAIEGEAIAYVEDGEYRYEFVDVPAGSYQIYAGADADNDFYVCDAGEACGAWPVLDSHPAVIELRQDLDDMDFSTTFNTGIISGASLSELQRGLRRGLRRSSYRPASAAN